MGPQNSHEHSYMLLLVTNVLHDISSMYPSIQKTFQRDIETIVARYSKEGFNFLSMALPRLGKALEQGLETGVLKQVEGFRTLKHAPAIPSLFSGMWLQVFTCEGCLRPDASTDAIRHLRQVCVLSYKLEVPFRKKVLDDFQRKFVETDESITDECPDHVSRLLRFNVTRILARVFEGFNPRDILPKHGPGAVSTGERLEEKWEFKRLYNSLHQCYPYYEYFVAGVEDLRDRVNWYRCLQRVPAGTTKVVFVPKDSRGPRVISSEPLEYMYIQQGLAKKIVSRLEKGCWLTRGRVNFADQGVNQKMALSSSRTKSHVTVDLAEASDRVPLWALDFFPEEVSRFLRGTRSTHTVLPNGERIQLKKFAPMGSALCFPVESLFFYAVCVAAVIGLSPITSETVKYADCYVYGDDIIVPDDHYQSVCEALEAFGLRVNRHKSFRNGYFRESCGMDAYMGEDVTVIKIRTPWSGKPSDGNALQSWAAYGNSLLPRYPRAAAFVRSMISLTYGEIPYGTQTSPYPCIQVPSPFEAEAANIASGRAWRWNESLQSLMFKVKTTSPRTRDPELDGWQRLLCDLLTDHSAPSKVVEPRSTQIRTRWCAV